MGTRIKGKFLVSTIYRQCSAVESYGSWYYETMVFHIGEDGKTGAIADQAESHCEAHAVRTHTAFVTSFCSDLPEIEEQVEKEHERIQSLMDDMRANQ